MEIGWVGREALPVFQSLLLPGAAAEAERGDPVTVLGAEEGGVACGAAAARLRGPALEVVSLYVAPDHRRRGAGRALTEALLELGRGRAEDLEVSYTATLPDHDTLPPFLAALGFQRDGGEETGLPGEHGGAGPCPLLRRGTDLFPAAPWGALGGLQGRAGPG